MAGEQFEAALNELRRLVVELEAVEQALEEQKGPWTPGRVPDWP